MIITYVCFCRRTGERMSTSNVAKVIAATTGVNKITVTVTRKIAETFFKLQGLQNLAQCAVASNMPIMPEEVYITLIMT